MGFRYQQSLERLKVPQLRQLARLLGVGLSVRMRRYHHRKLKKQELIDSINSQLQNRQLQARFYYNYRAYREYLQSLFRRGLINDDVGYRQTHSMADTDEVKVRLINLANQFVESIIVIEEN